MKIQIYNFNFDLIEVEAEKVEFEGFEKFHFFLHHSQNLRSAKNWTVSELGSKASVYQGDTGETRKQVIEKARIRLQKNGIKRLKQAITKIRKQARAYLK